MSRLVYFVAVVAAVGCSDSSGCNTQPLPGGALPADQTIEGGAQIRVTRQGFTKLTAIVPGLINSFIGQGFCVPEGTEASINYCYQNQNQCTNGCDVDVVLNGTTFSATNSYTLTIRLDVNIDATVPVDSWWFSACNIIADGNNITGLADLEMRTDATTGELTVQLARVRNVNMSGLALSGSSGSFCDGAAGFADFLKDYFAQELVDYLTPRLNQMIQDQLPNPMGLEGVVDVTPLVAGISPGTKGAIEARIIPGGYAVLDSNAQGLTLGVITGINSDEDPGSRSAALDSEPALCVPPILPPSFGAVPYALPTTSRGTYLLPAAPAFSGQPDPGGSDLSVGLSQTALNLIGHHAVTSGVMCLGIGTALVPQLNVGTFGLLVPSVGELANDDGHDPILLVTRPQKAIEFTIGDNTAQSPAITIHLKDFEIDVYPFLYERYVRAFTMSTTLNIGVNLDFDHPAGSPWRVTPTLVGLGAGAVTVKVLNNDFIAETATQLEGALPSVFDLLTSQLTIPPVELPTFAGFEIGNPSIAKVTSPDGNFLALNANLNVSMMMRQLTQNNKFMSLAVDQIDQSLAPDKPRSVGTARLRSVDVPKVEAVRAALAKTGGKLPAVTFDVDRYDIGGRQLEWSWRLGNGMWRPYTDASPLVISDRAFAWQGEYTIGLMSRVKGEPATSSPETTVPVVIDSVGPHVVTSKVDWDEEVLKVPGWDIVSGPGIRIAFGRPGDDEPRTEWQSGGTGRLDRMAINSLVDNNELAVFLDDEAGNRTIALVAPFHGQAGASGCNCDAGGGVPTGGILLSLVTVVGLVRKRRR